MENCLPPKQLDLKGGGNRTATRPESMEGVVIGDGSRESEIDNHCHRLPNHLHKDFAAEVLSPFCYKYHRLPGRLLCNDPVS